jgi:hypothetical protein
MTINLLLLLIRYDLLLSLKQKLYAWFWHGFQPFFLPLLHPKQLAPIIFFIRFLPLNALFLLAFKLICV